MWLKALEKAKVNGPGVKFDLTDSLKWKSVNLVFFFWSFDFEQTSSVYIFKSEHFH